MNGSADGSMFGVRGWMFDVFVAALRRYELIQPARIKRSPLDSPSLKNSVTRFQKRGSRAAGLRERGVHAASPSAHQSVTATRHPEVRGSGLKAALRIALSASESELLWLMACLNIRPAALPRPRKGTGKSRTRTKDELVFQTGSKSSDRPAALSRTHP